MEEERIAIKQLNEQMFNAVLEDNINKVEESLDFGANNFGNCIKFAAHYGRLFILKSLVEVGSFDSKQLEPAVLPESCVLLFGQEGAGMSDEGIAVCEVLYEINQYGSTRSMNASAAGAIAMYHWALQHLPR